MKTTRAGTSYDIASYIVDSRAVVSTDATVGDCVSTYNPDCPYKTGVYNEPRWYDAEVVDSEDPKLDGTLMITGIDPRFVIFYGIAYDKITGKCYKVTT
jgi:hypothetical protein